MTLLDLFWAGMSSVMVTSPRIPPVIINSISALLRGAEPRTRSHSNRLFVDYWQDAGTCQQHVRQAASPSVESHRDSWHSPLCAPSVFPKVLSLRGCPETASSSLLTREISWKIAKTNRCFLPILSDTCDNFRIWLTERRAESSREGKRCKWRERACSRRKRGLLV